MKVGVSTLFTDNDGIVFLYGSQHLFHLDIEVVLPDDLDQLG